MLPTFSQNSDHTVFLHGVKIIPGDEYLFLGGVTSESVGTEPGVELVEDGAVVGTTGVDDHSQDPVLSSLSHEYHVLLLVKGNSRGIGQISCDYRFEHRNREINSENSAFFSFQAGFT